METKQTIQEIFGSELSDLLMGTPQSDLIKGLEGNDFIIDGMGNDGSFGNEGNDFFFDSPGNDIIRGGDGNDFAFGVSPINGGNDFIDLGKGNDVAFGGAGADTFVLNRNSGVTLIGDFTPGEDRFALGGSLTKDDLSFTRLDNDSPLNGSTLIADTETGELVAFVSFVPPEAVSSADFVSAERIFLMGNSPTGEGDDPIEVELQEGLSGNIIGSFDADLIIGNRGKNLILAGDGDDFVNAGGGKDEVFGEDGNDIINGERGRDLISGGAGADILNGGRGADTLLGETGNDVLNGDRGNDVLLGGSGSDVISGGRGNDLIFGGAGNDALFGDRGSDIFVFAPGEGADIIFDFEVGRDAIALQGSLNYNSLDSQYNASGNYSTITDTQSGDLIATLIGVDATSLGADDYTTV